MAELKGKVALVTGATSGIGAVTAEYLAGNELSVPEAHIGTCQQAQIASPVHLESGSCSHL
jgi:NADP-dependent 3-hydroxy acid dehydrogenase YdfG